MICKYCGMDNLGDEVFCSACGKLLVGEIADFIPPSAAENGESEPPRDDYGETEPYYTRAVRFKSRAARTTYAPRQKSRVPYLIVSFLTALLSVLCFVLPYREWVSYHYSLLGFEVSDGNLSLSELAKRFYDNRGILALVTGSEDEYLSSMIPDNIHEMYAKGRLVALGLAVAFLIALVLYALFILSVLLRLRGAAATFGVLASLLYGGATVGVMYGVNVFNSIVLEYDDYSWNLVRFKLLDAPYIALALAALILVLCLLFAVLGSGTRRGRR